MKNRVVILVLLTAAVLLSITLTGCGGPKMTWGAPGLTSQQVNQRHYETIQVGLWELQDDIDAFWMFDRPGRMNRLSVR